MLKSCSVITWVGWVVGRGEAVIGMIGATLHFIVKRQCTGFLDGK